MTEPERPRVEYCCAGLLVLERELALLREEVTRREGEQNKYLEHRFHAQDMSVQTALTSARDATLKAEAATEKRLDLMNEFRATLSDQATQLMPRTETELRLTAIEKDVAMLYSRLGSTEGVSKGLGVGWAYTVGAVVMITAVATVIVRLLMM